MGRPARPLQRIFKRLTSSQEEIEAEELLEGTQVRGGTPINRCADRERVTVSGTLRTVTLRPRAGVPALEAELYDGSGTVSLVWLGRRRVPGIEPGRVVVVVDGRITYQRGGPVIYNPRYELRPVGAA